MLLVVAEVGREVREHSREEVVGDRGDADADAHGHVADIRHVGAAHTHEHLVGNLRMCTSNDKEHS